MITSLSPRLESSSAVTGRQPVAYYMCGIVCLYVVMFFVTETPTLWTFVWCVIYILHWLCCNTAYVVSQFILYLFLHFNKRAADQNRRSYYNPHNTTSVCIYTPVSWSTTNINGNNGEWTNTDDLDHANRVRLNREARNHRFAVNPGIGNRGRVRYGPPLPRPHRQITPLPEEYEDFNDLPEDEVPLLGVRNQEPPRRGAPLIGDVVNPLHELGPAPPPVEPLPRPHGIQDPAPELQEVVPPRVDNADLPAVGEFVAEGVPGDQPVVVDIGELDAVLYSRGSSYIPSGWFTRLLRALWSLIKILVVFGSFGFVVYQRIVTDDSWYNLAIMAWLSWACWYILRNLPSDYFVGSAPGDLTTWVTSEVSLVETTKVGDRTHGYLPGLSYNEKYTEKISMLFLNTLRRKHPGINCHAEMVNICLNTIQHTHPDEYTDNYQIANNTALYYYQERMRYSVRANRVVVNGRNLLGSA